MRRCPIAFAGSDDRRGLRFTPFHCGNKAADLAQETSNCQLISVLGDIPEATTSVAYNQPL